MKFKLDEIVKDKETNEPFRVIGTSISNGFHMLGNDGKFTYWHNANVYTVINNNHKILEKAEEDLIKINT